MTDRSSETKTVSYSLPIEQLAFEQLMAAKLSATSLMVLKLNDAVSDLGKKLEAAIAEAAEATKERDRLEAENEILRKALQDNQQAPAPPDSET